MTRLVTGIALSLSLAACSQPSGLVDGRHPTGSSTLVASSDYAAVYAVNPEAGTVARFAPGGSTAVDEVEVGREPTRIARGGDRVFVTLRAERAVVALEETPAGLQPAGRAEVGAEPYGVVASEDGSRVYVAVSQADRVVELDAKSLEELRSWRVPKEPRYLALHPSGKALYVAAGNGEAEVTRIDLTAPAPEAASGEAAGQAIELPDVFRFDADFNQVRLTPRVTGDLAISPDGVQVVVPVIYVDNVTPVGTPEGDEPVQDGYGSVTEGVGRFNPAVAVITTSPDGEASGEVEPVFIGGDRSESDGRMVRVRSYPSSVTVSPDGVTWVVTVQGSDTVSVIGALPFESRGDIDFGVAEPMPAFDTGGGGSTVAPFTPLVEAGFAERPKALVRTAGLFGPSGAVFLAEDEAFVHSTFERQVANVDYRMVFEDVRRNGLSGFDEPSFRESLGRSPTLGGLGDMPADAERGRRLFFGSTNPSMVASGAGVSCASCHFEGRNDGLTWSFQSGDRQTPSLAGRVSLTAPVTWTSEVDSVATEAQLTTELRMGGHSEQFNGDVARPDYAAIAAFVDWTRHVDVQDKGAATDAVARGRAIFERADVGCASCHSGEVLTDNAHHRMFGLERVNTPTLVGIAATAPYLHDGRASDLRAVLEWSRSGEMGDTSMLSEAEMQDLEAYLRSL